jgi:1-acyl-sn-glycerol-3-phosphate acyltransferase
VLQLKRRSDRADGGGLIVRDGAWDASLLVPDQIEFAGRKGFIELALDRGVAIVPVVAIGGQETALFATRGERAVEATGWAKLSRIKVLPVAFAPPFGATMLDLPGRLPLPAKITVEVRPRSTSVSASDQDPSPKASTRRSPARCRTGCPSSKKSAHSPSSDRQAAGG